MATRRPIFHEKRHLKPRFIQIEHFYFFVKTRIPSFRGRLSIVNYTFSIRTLLYHITYLLCPMLSSTHLTIASGEGGQRTQRHLRIQVKYPQRRGTGTHDGEPTEQGEQVPQLRTPRPQHKGRTWQEVGLRTNSTPDDSLQSKPSPKLRCHIQGCLMYACNIP